MSRFGLIACGLFLFTWLGHGQTRPEPTEIDSLKKRIRQLEEENRDLRRQLDAFNEAKAKPKPLDIRINQESWKKLDSSNIRAVCLSAANELAKYTPQRTYDPIIVTFSTKGPMVVYGLGNEQERRVLLNVDGAYWSQFAYQFAHEFCHIMCNYRDGQKQNLWFEESLCETASIFAIRRMAQTWKIAPPYSNWKSYSDSLQSYADDHVKKIEPLKDMTLAQWYARNEEALRKNGTDRPKNQVVAKALLPLFEEHPEHWAALEGLNRWDKTREISFKEYLTDWHNRVAPKHQLFVHDVAKLFGITITPS